MTIKLVHQAVSFGPKKREAMTNAILFGNTEFVKDDPALNLQCLELSEALQMAIVASGRVDSLDERRATLNQLFDDIEKRGYKKPRPTYRAILRRRGK
jgi:hypothetical protein